MHVLSTLQNNLLRFDLLETLVMSLVSKGSVIGELAGSMNLMHECKLIRQDHASYQLLHDRVSPAGYQWPVMPSHCLNSKARYAEAAKLFA